MQVIEKCKHILIISGILAKTILEKHYFKKGTQPMRHHFGKNDHSLVHYFMLNMNMFPLYFNSRMEEFHLFKAFSKGTCMIE